MFTADDIQTRMRHRPFIPLRFVTSAGLTYDVYHPELVMVGRRFIVVGTASMDNPTQFEQASQLSIMHITALQNLPSPVPPTTNGAA